MVDKGARKRTPISKVRQLAIFRRDQWLCTYCRRAVIFAPAMRMLEMEAKQVPHDSLAYFHTHWTRRDAPLLDELGAVIDHAEAHSTGGGSHDENLVTACNKCNGRKSSLAMERWEARHRRKSIKGIYGEPTHWDGLSLLFILFAQKRPEMLTATDKDWLRALLAVPTDAVC